MTNLQKAHRWLRTYLRKQGFERTNTHPVHTSLQLYDVRASEVDNLSITASISLLCYTGQPVRLELWGNRNGPGIRWTVDGPIELDYPIPGITDQVVSWLDFEQEGSLEDLKRTVEAWVPGVKAAWEVERGRFF